MIGLDTNVLLRYFMQDDIRQSAKAGRLINSLSRTEQGFVSLVVVAELVWALSYGFQLDRGELHAVLVQLVNMPELKVEKTAQVLQALRQFKVSSVDLADCLIIGIAKNAGCSRTATFDRKAARLPGAFYIG
ncbi:PIN domain-containing protein [Duganella sp. FT135W]|uniref:PIN domain-containing protein n=1 Tax=Duganella flavida TaxID=2692175 RepID=A0A6L8KGR0_9BURK|nr:type II toxin-antitoxin system VapC family toxin [Duganella flavida]MYM23651.1 PIN domain-containing protein [Duganella flavida]